MDIKKLVEEQVQLVKENLPSKEISKGIKHYEDNDCCLLAQSGASFEFFVRNGSEEELLCEIGVDSGRLYYKKKGERIDWDAMAYACLLVVQDELKALDPKGHEEHKKYTRDGMKKRVLEERSLRAAKAEYKIKWAMNIYGDHILINEKGVKYRVFLRDFENETGYSDSEDARLNKLGTTKHIMYAFDQLKKDKALYNRLLKEYPFIEIYCDPLNDYRISWHYPHKMQDEERALIEKYFGSKTYIDADDTENFLGFIDEAKDFESIRIRPEVIEMVESLYDDKLLELLQESSNVDFSPIKADLFDYQKQGVSFILFKKAAIIADEMGLGKTLQAISSAVLKKTNIRI